MKIIYCFPIIFITVFTSCNNDSTQKSNRDDDHALSAVDCYSYTSVKDTVYLQLNSSNNSLTGELLFKLFEKDQNKGTIAGTMKGDTLFATYTFMSEGMESVREVAFLKKGNDFIEGYGDIEEKNGEILFENHNQLTFNDNMVLKHVDCSK